MDTRLLINGKFVAGQGDAEKVLNPATGRGLPRCPKPRARRWMPR